MEAMDGVAKDRANEPNRDETGNYSVNNVIFFKFLVRDGILSNP